MNITLSNFKDKIPVIREAIETSNFLSIDGEFTGLNQEWNLNAYDTPTERFQKVRQNAEDFLLIQLGLCTFHYDRTTEKYTHQAFNFYIFPRTYKRITPDKRFYCQASSLYFLISQGFDFNKLYKEGISYIRLSDESSIREAHAQRQLQRSEEVDTIANGTGTPKTPCVVPEEHKDFIENIHTQVEDFLSSDKNSVKLNPCSGYRRKLIYETVKPKYQNLSLETIQTDKGQPVIEITKTDKEENQRKTKARTEAENEQLEEAIGFTKVVQMIVSSGKLVVGHNMFLDMLHFIHKFCCELPEHYLELKDVVKSVLPRVLDTKLMASTSPLKEHFQGTSLNEIFKRVNEKPFTCPTVAPSENCLGYNTASEQFHEAGYDAFITGLCFISLAQYLSTLQKKNKKIKYDCGSSALIEPYVNKVYMMMSPDIPYINMAGHDIIPNREHVFYVTFPSEWKSPDIYSLFSAYGPVSICWINDTSAFVTLKHPDKSIAATKAFVKSSSDVYNVVPYSEFRKRQEELPTQKEASPCTSTEDSLGPLKRKVCGNRSPGNDRQSTQTSDEQSEKESPSPKRQKQTSKLFEEPTSWD